MMENSKMPFTPDLVLEDMYFGNSDNFFLVKPPPPIKEEERKQRERELFTYPRIVFSNYAKSIFNGDAPGTEKVDYLFYPGCHLSASNPEYVETAYKYLLSRIKEGVGIMLGCCGAPAEWAGRQDMLQENIEKFQKVWNETGKPVFILACSSCAGTFERYMPKIPYVTLWEIFTRYGLPDTAKADKDHSLNIHDACSKRPGNEIHASVRKIATALGYEIKEPGKKENDLQFCSYGSLALDVIAKNNKDFPSGGMHESNEDLLVYCAMCKELLADEGMRTFHILDLIFGEDMEKIVLKKMPAHSERHENMAGLKNKLLKELWGEEPE